MQTKGLFSGNQLKVLAAILMVVDHVGLMFFQSVAVFRYIGRLSMPIFAFMIAEGCRYTKNKTKYFGLLFSLAVVCQLFYALVQPKNLYFSILVTFSFGILVVYSLEYFKKSFLEKGKSFRIKILSALLLLFAVAFVFVFRKYFKIDYGFWGCMLPAFASLLDFRRVDNQALKKFDKLPLRVLCFAVGLLILVFTSSDISFSIYSLLALPLLFLYSGERGKLKMKYFFYIFYPLHLVVLGGILMLI